jgi:hypothetical protein
MMDLVARTLIGWSWLMDWWHERRRSTDLQTLWPVIRASALNMGLGIDTARAAFAVHAFNDSAWLVLGADEVARVIEGLN